MTKIIDWIVYKEVDIKSLEKEELLWIIEDLQDRIVVLEDNKFSIWDLTTTVPYTDLIPNWPNTNPYIM